MAKKLSVLNLLLLFRNKHLCGMFRSEFYTLTEHCVHGISIKEKNDYHEWIFIWRGESPLWISASYWTRARLVDKPLQIRKKTKIELYAKRNLDRFSNPNPVRFIYKLNSSCWKKTNRNRNEMSKDLIHPLVLKICFWGKSGMRRSKVCYTGLWSFAFQRYNWR